VLDARGNSMTRLLITFVAATVLVPWLAIAQGKPSPVEIKKVLDYYYGPTSDAIVLIDSRFCTDVASQGENKNECTARVPAQGIEVGKPVFLWMNFFVPANASDREILVQFKQGGVTRMTRQLTLSGSVRFRTWKKFTLDRPGLWSVKILQDKLGRAEDVASMSLTIREKPVARLDGEQPPVAAGAASPK